MASQISSSPSGQSPFIQSHSASLRLWHWLTFLFISGSIITVALNSTLLSQRDNVKLVQDQLQKKGVTVTEEQAFAVSHEYEEKVWDVHKLLGYGLAFLFLARVVIEFTQPNDEKVRSRIKRAIELKKNAENKAEYTHYLRVRLSYAIFFLLLFCMVLTGLGMAFGRNFGFTREVRGVLHNLHEIAQYLIYIFIVVHLVGVIIAENRGIKGIVSGMINGNKHKN